MTHTLHRHGDASSLKHDFVVLTMDNRRRTGLTWKERLSARCPRFYGLLKTVYLKLGLGGSSAGESWTSVFHSRDALREHIRHLKDADTGRSVVVSGVIDEVDACLGDLGLRPHTIQYSLGTFGRTDRLPSEEILEITTMCGHHLVSPRFVEMKMKAVDDGRISGETAAESMDALCLCKIFNRRRAAELMEDHAHRS